MVDPGIIRPADFLAEVLNVRIPNPFMPDTPQRIATDTSQKLPIRFGETIKAYEASDTLQVSDLVLIPLVFAGWLRYLMGIDDLGRPFEKSPDPLLDTLTPYVEGFSLGHVADAKERLQPLLKRSDIFGVDLYECGLAEKVLLHFEEMTAQPGAVAKTLEKYTN